MKKQHLTLVLAVLLSACAASASSRGYARIDSLIRLMTTEEKARMCFGGDQFGVVVMPGVPRLGIPDMHPSDGPRGPVGPPATAFPSGIGLATSWNDDLFERVGEVSAKEARFYGRTLLFGPALNINRDPLGGRFFEYLSDDPVLAGRLAGAQAKGIQRHGVAACLKHFAVNGRDLNRNEYSSNVDERTLRELYLRNFQIAYEISGAWSFMTAANRLNHDYCSDSKFLLNDVLKGEWGFKGLVLTDFCNTRSTEKAAFAGLDMGMPWGDYNTTPFGKPLVEAVEKGRIPVSVLDEMVRRILWVRQQAGLLDGVKENDGGVANTPEHQSVAKEAALESIVLLKNENKFLPLNKASVDNIVVVGPNANRRFCIHGLGGSSGVQAVYEVSPLAALQNRGKKDGFSVDYVPLTGDAEFNVLTAQNVVAANGKPGFTVEYYNSATGKHAKTTEEQSINFNWMTSSPVPERIPVGNVRIVCDGDIIAPETGFYTFRVSSDCPVEFWLDDMGAQAIRNVESGTPQINTALLYMEKGKRHHLRLWYTQNPQGVKNSQEMNHWNKDAASIKVEWAKPTSPEIIAGQLRPYADKLRNADCVVFVGGTDHNFDCEGRDRATMDFPGGQAELMRQIAEMNSKLITVLYHGSPFTTEWMKSPKAIVDAFFPGMEGGNAVADVIFGDYNPSGRLSFSWPAKLKESSQYAEATQDFNNVNYEDKLFVGYRWNDKTGIRPAFPFGFGLSYTSFEYSGLKAERQKDGTVKVTLKVKNTGKVAGKETVQLYVGQHNCHYERPKKELKDFKKVEIAAGKTAKVEFSLDHKAFEYWNPDLRQWIVDKDVFTIYLCKDASTICLQKDIRLE